MIPFLIFRSFILVIGAILSIIPIVSAGFGFPIDPTHIPFADAYLSAGLGYVRFLALLIPPLGIIYDGFLFVLGFKLVMWLLKVARILK